MGGSLLVSSDSVSVRVLPPVPEDSGNLIIRATKISATQGSNGIFHTEGDQV